MSKFKKIMIGLASLAVAVPIISFGYFYAKINSTYEEASAQTLSESKPIELDNDAVISDNITNILLIGTDARNKSEKGRSDTMMIATIDEKHRVIKLTSLARDSYVEIPGHGEQKLNHAYSYGGAKLLIETLENTLSIDISNYVTVNFSSFSSIIDALGGVNVEVKESELNELNKFIPECYDASLNKNRKMKLIEEPGVQTLNGYQALSYARIRKNDSALERDNRQRKVLQAIMDEASDMSFLEIPKVLKAVLPHIKTDMKFGDMVSIGKKVLKMGNFNIHQLEFPMEEFSKNSRLPKKGFVIEFDKDKSKKKLHEFIFGEEFVQENISDYENKENIENPENNQNNDNTNSQEESSVLEGFTEDNNSDKPIEDKKPEDFFTHEFFKDKQIENINTSNIPFV